MIKKKLKNKKYHSLKSKGDFESLFKRGKFIKNKNFGVRYYKTEGRIFFIGYAVSKNNFSKAVDRNLIKRRMRSEVYNLLSFFDKCPPGKYLFYYLGGSLPSSSDVNIGVSDSIKQIIQDT